MVYSSTAIRVIRAISNISISTSGAALSAGLWPAMPVNSTLLAEVARLRLKPHRQGSPLVEVRPHDSRLAEAYDCHASSRRRADAFHGEVRRRVSPHSLPICKQ